MEGSPVRGLHRWRKTWISDARSVQSYQSELVRVIADELTNSEVVFGQVEPGSSTLSLPSWLKAHLERHPTLYRKLEQGELVGISHVDQAPTPRPAAAARSGILIFPIICDGALYGAIALISPTDAPQLSQDDLEIVRQLANQAGPALAQLTEIERLRTENLEMNSLLKMRAHLQSNIAHELRTPLAAVRGYTRMILDGRAGQPNETQKEYMRVVADNTTRLINVVNWMTHVLELSADDFLLSSFDLRDVWKDSFKAAKPLKITEQIPGESFTVVGDRRKIARIFEHLLESAKKLATADSQIVVQFSRGRDHEITVKISDTGAVVPQELLTRIFDRSFTSVPMPLAPQPDGGELGLSDIYDIVGMHGGRFFVNSKTGQGVTFLFTLPAVESGGEEKLSHEQAINSGR
jgi:signal transduction histidine kinase